MKITIINQCQNFQIFLASGWMLVRTQEIQLEAWSSNQH